MSAKKTIVKISMQSNREEQMKSYLKKKVQNIMCQNDTQKKYLPGG